MLCRLKVNWFLISAMIAACSPCTGTVIPAATAAKAERLYCENLYSDAIPLYAQMLRSSAQPNHAIALKLAHCYLEISSPQDCLDILSPLTDVSEMESDRLYLMSLAYRQLNEHQQALDLLQSNSTIQQNDQLTFEKGLNSFYLKKFPEANDHFQSIQPNPASPQIYLLARLYLAQLALMDKQTKEAQELLKSIDIQTDHPLAYKKAYLQGLSYYQDQDYEQAINFFEKALSNNNAKVILYLIQSWYRQGLKELKDATATQSPDQFEKAAEALEKAYQLALQSDPTQVKKIIKPLALARFQEASAQQLARTIDLLNNDLRQDPDLLNLLGLLYFQNRNWKKADVVFAEVIEKDPACTEAYFWQALCADKVGDLDRKQRVLQLIFTEHPQSPFAPIAYFHYYPYRDFLAGDRKAIKHLHLMRTKYPDHPLIISANYLIGLDHIKDRLAEDGTISRRKDLIAAIDAFQKAESNFIRLSENNQMSASSYPYFVQIKNRSKFERALANLSIGQHSQGAKQEIYLEYAESAFRQLTGELEQTNLPLLEESRYWLVRTYVQRNKIDEANRLLDQAIAPNEQGYFPSRLWYEKGKIAQRKKQYAEAIEDFIHAETAIGDKPLLSPDQKLDLWIQRSLCHKELGQLDQAMKLLSDAVNDEAISSMRVKAMYLRAEVYELQGRSELAQKQLEAVSKKGGEWGKMAGEKLSEK